MRRLKVSTLALILFLAGSLLFALEAKGKSVFKVFPLPPPPIGPRQPLNQEVILEPIWRYPLSWPKVKKAALYHLEIASDRQFRWILISIYLAPHHFTIKSLPEGTIFWRVSSINDEGIEGKFSPVFYFVYPRRTPLGGVLRPKFGGTSPE